MVQNKIRNVTTRIGQLKQNYKLSCCMWTR